MNDENIALSVLEDRTYKLHAIILKSQKEEGVCMGLKLDADFITPVR